MPSTTSSRIDRLGSCSPTPARRRSGEGRLLRVKMILRQSQNGTKIQVIRVIAVSTLKAFWEQYPDAEVPLKAWLEEAQAAQWQQPADIKAHSATPAS